MVLKEVFLLVFRPGEVSMAIGFVLMLKMKLCFDPPSDLGEIINDLGEISVMFKRIFASTSWSRRDHICSRRDQCMALVYFCLGVRISARPYMFSARPSVGQENSWSRLPHLGETPFGLDEIVCQEVLKFV